MRYPISTKKCEKLILLLKIIMSNNKFNFNFKYSEYIQQCTKQQCTKQQWKKTIKSNQTLMQLNGKKDNENVKYYAKLLM